MSDGSTRRIGTGPGHGGPATGTAARGYRWPAFETQHGAWSPAVIEPLAQQLVAWLLEQANRPGSPIGFVAEPHYSPTVDKWARSEARRMRYEADVAEHGEHDERGNPRPVLNQLERWERRAAFHASALGLDPPSLARIRRDMAFDATDAAERTLRELQARYGPRRQVAERGERSVAGDNQRSSQAATTADTAESGEPYGGPWGRL